MTLPVAVLGAGPVGLAAAARLRELGIPHAVLEAGQTAGAHVREWAHVRMFTSWKWNVDAVARRLLERSGWTAPGDDEYPTGGDLWRLYLEPLSESLAPGIRLGHRVLSVGKRGFDLSRNGERDAAPFEVRFVHRGRGGALLSRAVLDATGTWSNPSPLGAGGYEAAGERELGDRIVRRIPDVLGRDRARFEDRSVLVVGSGDSAFTVLLDLDRLAQEERRTKVVWAFRGSELPTSYRRAAPFPACIALIENVRRLVETGRIEVAPGFGVEALEADGERLRVLGTDRTLGGVDVVVSSTGFRPDHGITRELRVAVDLRTECAAGLAAIVSEPCGSCGTVPRHGVAELSHPEAAYFAVGIKSYGRAPSFLLDTGYAQVASVVESLALPGREHERRTRAEQAGDPRSAGGCGRG